MTVRHECKWQVPNNTNYTNCTNNTNDDVTGFTKY